MNRLKDLRVSDKTSQAELGKLVNVTAATISKYENGTRKIPVNILMKLASHFGVTTDYLLGQSDVYTHDKSMPQKSDYIKIPLLGVVPGGEPIPAVEDWLGEVEYVRREMYDGSPLYALRIIGRSMSPRILDGDIVIVRSQNDVESGEIAIVLVDGEDATCKKVKKTDTGITLIGYNTDVYEPHFYNFREMDSTPVRIVGRVMEIRRKV